MCLAVAKISRSRTFAVILQAEDQIACWFITRKTDETGAKLEEWFKHVKILNKDELIDLLTLAGLTVRFYDPEEKQWMDHSKSFGSIRAPGPRDGHWVHPTTVEEFERDYLAVT